MSDRLFEIRDEVDRGCDFGLSCLLDLLDKRKERIQELEKDVSEARNAMSDFHISTHTAILPGIQKLKERIQFLEKVAEQARQFCGLGFLDVEQDVIRCGPPYGAIAANKAEALALYLKEKQ